MDMRIAERFSVDAVSFAHSKNQKVYLKKFGQDFGLSDIAYMFIKLPAGMTSDMCLITSYAAEWEKHYVENEYNQIDPVVSNSMKGILPFDWGSVTAESKQSIKFFGEAAEFGISSQGLSVPIRGAHGEWALLSVSSSESATEWASIKRHLLSDLTYFGHLVHTEVMKSISADQAISNNHLTQRECQVLSWASKGKSCWETGKILGLSDRTVNFYIRNATVKLGVVTKTQAVAKAVQAGLILQELPWM